jgi:predicted nucleic acid-binding protein
MFLLDTNILSEFSKPDPDEAVVEWLNEREDDMRVSVISIAEIRSGTERMPAGRRRAALETWLEDGILPRLGPNILPVTLDIADLAGRFEAMRFRLGARGDVADMLIAATAAVYDLTLTTRNTKHFSGLGLRLRNPFE